MNFGSIPISPKQDIIIKKALHLINSFIEAPHRYNAPKWMLDLHVEGNLTNAQWDIVDLLSVEKHERPTLMELVEQLGKRSTSSITKPRDMARKKIIETLLTMSYLLQDEKILINFLGEFIESLE